MFPISIKVAAIATALALPLGLAALHSPASAQPKLKTSTVSVLHAIPQGKGADVVDVFANNVRVFNNMKPGQLRTVKVPQGVYTLGVYADGNTPRNSEPLLESVDTPIASGRDLTVTANLDTSGAPALNIFVNNTTRNPGGEGRLTVRHIAAAPAVDVRADGTLLFNAVVNPASVSAVVPAKPYVVDVTLAGSDVVVLGPATVPVNRPINRVVYAWGSAADGTLQLAVQNVRTRR
jgi:hypothetical protein